MAQTELTNVPSSDRLAPQAAKARLEIKFRWRFLTELPKIADVTQESTLFEERLISVSAVAKLQSDNFKNQCRRRISAGEC